MLISHSDRLDSGEGYTPIGRIRAATGWHVVGQDSVREGQWKEAALQRLIETAEDYDADAIVDINYTVDGTTDVELTGIELQRIAATGVAVKIRRDS